MNARTRERHAMQFPVCGGTKVQATRFFCAVLAVLSVVGWAGGQVGSTAAGRHEPVTVDPKRSVVVPSYIPPGRGIGLPAGTVRAAALRHGLPVGGVRRESSADETPGITIDPNAFSEPRAPLLLQNFPGIAQTELSPPDPDIGVGPNHIVQVVNARFAVFDKCGHTLFESDIQDYLGDPAFLYDPKVVYDPWANRWLMLWHKLNLSPEESRLIVIASDSSEPPGLGGAYAYPTEAIQDAGTGDASWADYYDLGYGAEGIYLAGNQFRFSNFTFRYAVIRGLLKSEVYEGLPATVTDFVELTNADGSASDTVRCAEMQTSGGSVDAYLVNSRGDGGNKLTVWSLSDPAEVPVLTNIDLSVAAYDVPPAAVQPFGAPLDTIDCRLMNAVFHNGHLYTGLQENFQNDAWLRVFDLDPAGGAVRFDELFGAGGGLDYWFPTVAANDTAAIFVFARCGDFEGQWAEARYVDLADNGEGLELGASSRLKAGEGQYNGFRWGDYFGAQVDWGAPERIWFVGEYATSDPNAWGTWIGASSHPTVPAGTLTVTPTGTYSIFGPYGGPFGPASQAYTVTNPGAGPVDWVLTGLPSWLSATPTSGTLGPGGSTQCTVSVSAGANSLPLGSYSATYVFSDCSVNGGGSLTRSATITVVQNGAISVEPTDGFGISGTEGGPFSPTSKVYTLRNVGQAAVAWTAADNANYINTTPASGNLNPGQSANVTVATNTQINNLTPGTYNVTVTFTNTTNGQGNTTRPVVVTVLSKGRLDVQPTSGFDTIGPEGGPFAPVSINYTLSNTGQSSLNWTADDNVAFITSSPTSGTLAGGASAVVSVSVNDATFLLTPGVHNGTFTVTNTTNGLGNTTRALSVTVLQKGQLTVTPAEGVDIFGPPGGPFVPDSKVYTLTNVGAAQLSWTADDAVPWLDTTPPSGALSGGASVNVTVKTNAATNALVANTYSTNLTITNTTNGIGNTTRPIRVFVQPTPGVLEITPADGFSTSGPAGGPFTPPSKVYALRNLGPGALSWTADDAVAYLTTSPTSGTLTVGATANVTVATNAATNGLTAGTYNGQITFTNVTGGAGSGTRPFQVEVSAATCIPCDTNCDGSVNGFDVDSFVALLSGAEIPCAPCAGDTNADGSVNGFDIDPFVTALTTGEC
ncbi:MAG: hypothetical protein CHACPFDD_02528 [Phycisphaerae bacterium]|nr:hypothetical protein [Phycisphaerae bacterium]